MSSGRKCGSRLYSTMWWYWMMGNPHLQQPKPASWRSVLATGAGMAGRGTFATHTTPLRQRLSAS